MAGGGGRSSSHIPSDSEVKSDHNTTAWKFFTFPVLKTILPP